MNSIVEAEFGYELILAIPYLYWLHTQRQLCSTTSVAGSKSLYFFSKQHTEKTDLKRRNIYLSKEFPNINFNTELILDKWILPPYAEYYINDVFVYDKPLLIIHNKYTIEWGEKPFNYIDHDTLRCIIEMYKDVYQIVYIRPDMKTESLYTGDDNQMLDLREWDMLKGYGDDVIIFQNLLQSFQYDYNTTQMMLHANCRRFISVHGGNALLASIFGGTNIVLTIKGNQAISSLYSHLPADVIECQSVTQFTTEVRRYVPGGNELSR